MVWETIGAAIASKALDFGVSKLFGGGDKEKDRRMDVYANNIQQQKNFETVLNESIQRRVRDAKKAGVSATAAL